MAETNDTEKKDQASESSAAEELKKAAQAAENAQGAEVPPEVAQSSPEQDLNAQLAAAQAKAAETLKEVKAAMKINYFSDRELIAEQASRYRNNR